MLADALLSFSLAELTSVNLCTCFPMLPRLMQLIRVNASMHNRGIAKLRYGRSNEYTSNSGSGTNPVSNAYHPLEDDTSRETGQPRQGVKHQTVTIELVSQERPNTTV